MTLLEAVFAVLIMVTGVAALMGMIINVENANRSMALQHSSLDVFARISAQIRDAECDLLPGAILDATTSDPAFLPGAPPAAGRDAGWIQAPLNGSSITLVGTGDTNPELVDYVPSLIVAYRVRSEAGPVAAAPAFQIDVQVRQRMRDPVMDNINTTAGYWVRVYPVQKMCNRRDDASQRGEY